MKFFKYIFCPVLCLLVVMGFSSCTDDLLDGLKHDQNKFYFNDEGNLTLSSVLEIPEMTKASTRASLWDTPDYDNLQLYALVFEDGSGLKQYAKVDSEKHKTDPDHNHNELVEFIVTLQPTDKNAVIHLIATNQPNFEEMVTFGTEESVINALYTDRNYEAYWQRIDLGCYIPSKENTDNTNESFRADGEANAQKVADAMKHVPMIRNFCRVSINADAVPSTTFDLTGLYIINTVDRGSVAPYVADNPKGQRYVKYYKKNASGNYEGMSYAEISGQNHIGTLPIGVKVTNNNLSNIASKSEKNAGGNIDPVYIYERPARTNSTERTYAIIRGKYRGSNNDSFYKLDLGHISDTEIGQIAGIFEYYNLVRNFDFSINLLSVESEGYATIEEAASGPVFNNFSAAIEARNMFSISDGEDMLNLNHLTFVFTLPNQKLDLRAQYRNSITNGLGGIAENENLHIDWAPGEVINNIIVLPDEITGEDGFPWKQYEVYGNDPDDILREQIVHVYRGRKDDGSYGLYRVLHFFSHKPWPMTHVGIFPGLWQNPDEYPNWEWPKDERDIGQLKGSNLTLFFELPKGLPQAIFPLTFTIESDRQNIQNAYVGTAVVKSVPAKESLFYDENETDPNKNPQTSRIQYQKTVTWEEYYGGLSEESVGKSSHIVRCPFLTITDLSQSDVGNSTTGKSTTTIRIKNDNFGWYDEKVGMWKMYEETFDRDLNTSDPSPRNWDFTMQYWDNIMLEMTNRYDKVFNSQTDEYILYTADNNKTDELTFVDGTVRETIRIGNVNVTKTKPTLTNGTDGSGLRYVQTTNADDRLTTTLMYGPNKVRTLRLMVYSTDTNGARKAPLVQFVTDPAGIVTLPAAKAGVAENGYPQPYIYDITIPGNLNEIQIKMGAPTDNVNMRFYKIELYPRWDSFQDAIQ